MGRPGHVVALALLVASSVARAQEPPVPGEPDAPPVPTLARLCADVRSGLASGGWYEPRSVRCAVTRVAQGHGVEVAALTVTAERLSRDTEVRIAVRDAEGWRVVGTAGEVQLGHGWLGAISVRGCRVTSADEVEVDVRTWSAEAPAAGGDVPEAWQTVRVVCRRDGAWDCAPATPTRRP